MSGFTGRARVGEINNRIVPAYIIKVTNAREARIRQIFQIGPPRESAQEEMANYVVGAIASCSRVIAGDRFPCDLPHER